MRQARMTTMIWTLAAALVLVPQATATAGPKKGPDRTPSEWSAIFDDPERAAWQMPVTVMQLLSVREGDVVVDLGAGTGYFTGYLAVEVGASGRVIAADVDVKMLEHLRGRLDIQQQRVDSIVTEPDDPKLPPGAVDLVFVVNTWHHIQKRVKYLEKLEQALDIGGRVVVIDYRAGKLPVGPPPKHKLSRDKVVDEFRRAGWTLGAESVALPYQYFLTFEPPGADSFNPRFIAGAGDDG